MVQSVHQGSSRQLIKAENQPFFFLLTHTLSHNIHTRTENTHTHTHTNTIHTHTCAHTCKQLTHACACTHAHTQPQLHTLNMLRAPVYSCFPGLWRAIWIFWSWGLEWATCILFIHVNKSAKLKMCLLCSVLGGVLVQM